MNRSEPEPPPILIAVSRGIIVGLGPEALPWFGIDDERVAKGAPLAFFLTAESRIALSRLIDSVAAIRPPKAEILTFAAKPEMPVVVAAVRGVWRGQEATLLTLNAAIPVLDVDRREAALFDELAALSSMPVALVDERQGLVRRANRHFRELWGLPPENLAAVTLADLGLSAAVLRPTIAASPEDTSSLWLSPSSGSPRWFRVWARPLGAHEDPTWLLSLEDTSWQSGHGTNPAHRGPATSAVLDTVLEAVMTLDADGTLLQLNREAERLLGVIPMRRPEERHVALRGRLLRPDGRIIEPEELPGIVALRTGRAVRRVQMGIKQANGNCRWVQVNANPFFHDDGAVAGAVVTLSDITERREAEQALRRMDAQRREFLAVLSHELRNPLSPIHTSLHLLRRDDIPQEMAARALQVIERQTQHLTHLVDDLLDATRIAAGKIQLQRVPLELSTAIPQTIEDHKAAAAHKGVRLRFVPAETPLRLSVDPTRLSQVLGNLLNNAIRHTPPEGEIVVTTGQRGACATLCVRDSGEGIATPDLESLFTPFAQAPQGLARTAGGLGLGLAIVRGLVKLHGGAVEIESEGLGKGTAVTVTLPLDASIEASTQVSSPTPSPPRADDVPPQRILIVEDNEDAAMTLQAALAQQGHVVHTAATAKAALDLARTRCLDTVICDIGLPDVDGYALAGKLRETLGPSAALYALTGYAAPDDVERALDAGFDRHLKKPPRMSELSALLAAHARRADA